MAERGEPFSEIDVLPDSFATFARAYQDQVNPQPFINAAYAVWQAREQCLLLLTFVNGKPAAFVNELDQIRVQAQKEAAQLSGEENAVGYIETSAANKEELLAAARKLNLSPMLLFERQTL